MDSSDVKPTPFELSSPFKGPVGRFLFNLAKGPVERLSGLRTLSRLWRESEPPDDPERFPELALKVLGMKYAVPPRQLERIPREGPLIVLANHPYGAFEGIILYHILERIRSDVRSLSNFLLGRIPQMRSRLFEVDPFGRADSPQANIAPLKQALKWLTGGGVLMLFPSGRVSYLHLRSMTVRDHEWHSTTARIIRRTETPVLPVYFVGCNGPLFQMAGVVHPRLRTAMLPRAFLKCRGRTLGVRIGNVVPFSKLDSFSDDREMLDYLRMRTYMLGADGGRTTSRRTTAIRRHREHQAPVMPPVAPALLENDIAGLSDDRRLMSSSAYDVWWAEAAQVPNVLGEIGRLREMTFRQISEGTGTACDLDRFDDYYQHLFVWNRVKRELVGAYRLGQTDVVLPKYGQKGLYTSTMYKFAPRLLTGINPALELGRSFVRPEYQKQHSPMALLWRGIGAFVARHPRYRILFGPVGISDEYQSVSRQMMIAFLKANACLPGMAKLVKARHPVRLEARDEVRYCRESVADIGEVSSLVSGIEEDEKGVPVLLRQYLRLNARFLACNVDAEYGNVWLGLMMADLTEADPRILDRHMGKSGAAHFCEYHRKCGRLAG